MVEPRAQSEEKLTPPTPLPHVSRRALARVKGPLPVPTVCRYCQGVVELVGNETVYGSPFGQWPYLYLCTGCRAYVGLHPDTDIPLGTLADKDLRLARKSAKALFLAANEDVSRSSAYQWLADQMGIDVSDCHFGWFDIHQCRQAKVACLRAIREA